METTIFQIEFNDGRTFRIFCANSTQKRKLIASYEKNKSRIKEISEITNGIHTLNQYEKLLKTI